MSRDIVDAFRDAIDRIPALDETKTRLLASPILERMEWIRKTATANSVT